MRFKANPEYPSAPQILSVKIKAQSACKNLTMDREGLSSQNQWSLFIHHVKDYAFIVLDENLRVTRWNSGAERMLGYTEEEITGQPGAILFVPEDRATNQPEREMATALRDGRAEDERWHIRKDGSRFRASGVLISIRNDAGQLVAFAKVMRDVTEREQARERMDALLRQRTVLLQEIQHRVKNNLQVISSLLRLQEHYAEDEECRTILEETQNRIQAIAKVHERLYATQSIADLDFGEYAASLAFDLQHFYGATGRIEITVEVTGVWIPIRNAVPLGLITSELVCNAFKHAFPDNRRGRIAIFVGEIETVPGAAEASTAELRVTDNGVGLPEDVELDTASSMGFDLLRTLAEQINAQIVLERKNGTSVRVIFPLMNRSS